MEPIITPAHVQAAYLDGLWHGGLGTGLIIFGLIGWQRTRLVLYTLLGRKPKTGERRAKAKSRPLGQSRHNRNRRGFGIAPVLYLLGLVGVAGGILFSNYMQSFVGMMKIQNGLTVRNDLMGASASLAAQSVFSADNTTLCPPRSVHQTVGDPCAAAPVGLIQFQDFPGINNLPTNYANAGSTGLPTEVGVFAVGTNKQLDSYGHTYIYCRWENTRANPAAPAFVLISAGPDGNLQTHCGDTVAQGDNFMISFPVAEAITHASLWQPAGTTSVSYGAAGSQVTVDADGDLTAAGTISAASAAITNGITAATLTTTGDVTAKDFIGLGTVSGSLGSFGTLNASSAAITNGITAATLTTSGDMSGLDLSVSGTVSGNTGSFVTLNASNAAITNAITATSLTASGTITGASGTFTTLNGTNATITNNLTATNITASGVVTGATGTFTTLNATNASITGNSNFGATTVSGLTNTGNESIAGTLAVTGATTGSSATYTGIVTAAGFNGSMSIGSGGVTVSGVLPVANGGTGANNPASALVNLGITSGGYLAIPLPLTGVAAGVCALPTVATDGRVTACGSAAPAQAAGTTGDIQFNNSGNLAASSGLYWDNVIGRLGIGTTSPQAVLDVTGNGTGSFPNSNGSLSQFSIPNGNYWATVYQDLSNSNRNYDIGISSWGTSDGKLGIVQVNSLEGITFIPAAVAGKNADDVLAINSNLEVVNTAWSSVYLFVNDITGNTGLSTSSPASTLSVNGGAAIGATYAAANAAGANNLIVQGKVGIGTASPAGTLDVEGGTAAASAGGASIKLVAQNAGTGNVNGGNIYLTTGTGSGTGYGGTVLIGNSCSGASWLANGLCAAGDIYSLTGFATANYQAYGWGTSTASISGVGSGSASDQIRFNTNSVERARFDGSGHFGLATASPQNTLDVSGAVAIGASYAGTSISPANGLIVQGSVAIGTSSVGALAGALTVNFNGSIQNGLILADTYTGGRTWGLGDDTGVGCSPGQFCIFDATASATRLLVNPSGYVGINTGSPQSMLQVYGGEVQTGSSGASCSSANSGAIRYSSGSLLFCNGAAWTAVNTATINNNAGWGAFKNLLIVNDGTTPNTVEDITADYVNLTDDVGDYYLAQGVVCNVNLASSGAGGLDTGSIAASTGYYDFVIYNGTIVSCLGSKSQTAPTMPSGYTYKALVGWNSTDSTSKLYRVRQVGNRAQYTLVTGTNTASYRAMATANASSWTALAVSAATSPYIPPNASEIWGVISAGTTSSEVTVSPDNACTTQTSGEASYPNTTPCMLFVTDGAVNGHTESFNFLLESPNIYYTITGTQAGVGLYVTGWRWNW